ncbi:MAG: hypothetical protein ACI9R3_005479 [Verrucomicrobiales bacterium]|jgi:hypothetical protein
MDAETADKQRTSATAESRPTLTRSLAERMGSGEIRSKLE